MTNPRTLGLDFETASEADLKRTGAAAYAQHPSTRVLCMAWAFDNDPVRVWREGEPFPDAVRLHVLYGHPVRAWNAAFEWNIWNHTLRRQVEGAAAPPVSVPVLSLAQLYDTMAQAAYYGLPLSLDMAAKAAGVAVLKDSAGHSLMLRMCRPRAYAPDGSPRWWHLEDPDKFDALCAYCGNDVDTERAVAAVIPPMPASERAIWLLDQRINQRGVHVDLDLVARLRDLALLAAHHGERHMQALTGGEINSVNSVGAMLPWLQARGYPFDNLQKGTVAERLEDPACQGIEREVLELRADVAKTSAAKLAAMLSSVSPSNFPDTAPVCGMLQYYGAVRTGRWAGRLIQLQNMPRGTLDEAAVRAAVQIIKTARDMKALFPVLEAMFGPVMGVVSSLLRSCIVPRPGNLLAVADSAQIEARVLPWLAGEQWVLDAFKSGQDLYKVTAAAMFNVPVGQVTKGQRQMGKVAELACGFQGGVGAFQTMAANYGLKITDQEAESHKNAWRASHPRVVDFWADLDHAARHVLTVPGSVIYVRHLRFGMVGRHMVMVLPSGRALWYRDARLQVNPENGREEITYMGLNQYTRKWERLKTYGGKLAENATQATARDVLAYAMVEADKAGIELVLTVHDEILTEAPADRAKAQLATLETIMSATPAWAPGLPVGADGWAGDRYKK